MALSVWGHPLGPVQANCYVLRDEDRGRALVIDPGADDAWLRETIAGYTVEAILISHAHFDHIGGAAALQELTGAPILIHQAEAEWLTDPQLNGSARRLDVVGLVTAPAPARFLEHGQQIAFADQRIEVRHTPGHSPGSVSFIFNNICICGDALFQGSIGRTDLPFSDHEQLLSSIREQLLSLPDETTVLPGHGPKTTIGNERRTNPFLL